MAQARLKQDQSFGAHTESDILRELDFSDIKWDFSSQNYIYISIGLLYKVFFRFFLNGYTIHK